MILRIYSFLAIVIQVILLTMAYMDRISYMQCIIPGLVMLYIYLVLHFAVEGKSGHRSKIMVLSLLAVLFLFALDYVIGYNGWSINYVLPSAILFVDIGLILLIFINNRNWQSYLMPELLMVLVSLAGMILYWCGVITFPTAIVAAFDFSVLLFVGTVIIGGRRARTELKRRFHIS